MTVHYHQGLEAVAPRAAALATEILDRHAARYGVRVPRVQIVLVDTQDDPNGFTSPLPYPLVQIRMVAPAGREEFGNYDDWLRLVLTHELAHVVHLEEARGLLRVGRKLLGRAPILFPNASSPTWLVEGLATFEETEATAFGRGRNPDVRMILRMAALEGVFPDEDRPVAGLDRWPGGSAAYFFGEAFLRDLTRRFGPATVPDLARVHSGRVIPYLDEITAVRVTGATYAQRWREWRQSVTEQARAEADALRAAGLTTSVALTSRGVRQTGPRWSPDGRWIAFTDSDLVRYRAIHLIRPDGTGERELVKRNGGVSLAWSPDGRTIVFDEPEVYRLFEVHYDLRAVDVGTGRTRWLTRGARARDPDVSPDGRTVVFVRQKGDGAELATVGLEGGAPRDLTRSAPGTEWSSPRWSPAGDALVASRWTSGGHLDVVRVDPGTGEATLLTDDRAKDVEPCWTPDGAEVVFRSDRDGISNLYALRLADGALRRVTRVLGGAFAPDVAPDGRRLAFSSYGARGYDLHVLDLDTAALPPADPFEDAYPPAAREPAEVAIGPERPYHAGPLLWPRFWMPYANLSSDETKVGAVTGGADALLRHVWGADAHYGTSTGRLGFRGVYQYDRFRPTLLATVEDSSTPEPTEGDDAYLRKRELQLHATVPLFSTFRMSHSVAVAWRRSRETLEHASGGEPLDLGGIEAAWALSTVKAYPWAVSPLDGGRLRISYLKEAPAFGSDLDLGKLTVDGRAYVRVAADHALALRAGAGWTFGEPRFRRSFAVGGFPDGALFDIVRTNSAVLRGYPQDGGSRADEFTGRRFAVANAEYRFPLAHPQRGYRLLPVFVRHVHAAAFVDAAQAWSRAFRLEDVKTGAGAALGADLVVGHALPLTVTAGLARGFSAGGDTQGYFRLGLSY